MRERLRKKKEKKRKKLEGNRLQRLFFFFLVSFRKRGRDRPDCLSLLFAVESIGFAQFSFEGSSVTFHGRVRLEREREREAEREERERRNEAARGNARIVVGQRAMSTADDDEESVELRLQTRSPSRHSPFRPK